MLDCAYCLFVLCLLKSADVSFYLNFIVPVQWQLKIVFYGSLWVLTWKGSSVLLFR